MDLSTVVGKYTTYDSQYLPERVKALALLVEPKHTITWDLLPEDQGGEIENDTKKFRWFDAVPNNLEGAVDTGGWDNAATTGLVISDATARIINIGDVVKAEDEVVIVKAVDRTVGAATIDVYSRGHGSTDPAAHVAGTVLYIVGNAAVEGKVDVESIIEDGLVKYNYFQLFEETIELTVTAANHAYEDLPADVRDKLDQARQQAMRRMMKKLNLAALFGIQEAGSKTTPRTTSGLIEMISNSVDNINYNANGVLTEDKLKEFLAQIVARGGNPNAIMVSPADKAIFNTFNAGTIYTARSETVAGSIVQKYLAEGLGELEIITEPLLKAEHGQLLVLNTNKTKKMWFKNDTLRFVKETNVNSRTIKETLQGQVGFMLKDAATDHGRMYGITHP